MLMKLSLKVLKCYFDLTRMNLIGDLNSWKTMKQVVRALTYWLQDLWAGSIDDMLRCGKDPKFSDLRALVSREARISRDRFGKLSVSRPPRSTRTPNRKQISLINHSNGLLLIRKNGSFHESPQ